MKTFSLFHKATPYPSSVKDLFSFLSEQEDSLGPPNQACAHCTGLAPYCL